MGTGLPFPQTSSGGLLQRMRDVERSRRSAAIVCIDESNLTHHRRSGCGGCEPALLDQLEVFFALIIRLVIYVMPQKTEMEREASTWLGLW